MQSNLFADVWWSTAFESDFKRRAAERRVFSGNADTRGLLLESGDPGKGVTLGAWASCLPALDKKSNLRFAALPPSVRKASGIPSAGSNLKSRLCASTSNKAIASIEAECGFAEGAAFQHGR